MSRAVEAYVDAVAPLSGFDLSVESRAAVVANLKILGVLAQTFGDEPLDPHLDPLAMFRP